VPEAESRSHSQSVIGVQKKPLIQKGFLEDSISSSNLTMLNNRQYSLLAEPTVTASFQSFTHIPGTDNILSESHEDLLQMLKQKSNIQHTNLHSIDGTRPQQNQLSMHVRQQ
jgi:hypothetical protein